MSGKGKKKALDSFFSKTKKKKSSKKTKKESEKKEDVESSWDIDASVAPTTTAAKVAQVQESVGAAGSVKHTLDEEEAKQKFWSARQQAAVKKSQPEPEVERKPALTGWRARQQQKEQLTSAAAFPTLSGKAPAVAPEKEENEGAANEKPAAKVASIWAKPAAAEVVPEEEPAVTKVAIGEDVDLIPGLGDTLNKADLKEQVGSMTKDLRSSHEVDEFLGMALELNPSEDDFKPTNDVSEPLYDNEGDFIMRPQIALQCGRQVIIEKLIEAACDWDEEDRPVVADALVALLTPQEQEFEIADEETGDVVVQVLNGAAIDRSTAVAGVTAVLEFFDDIKMDVPQADKYFAEMLRPLVIVEDEKTQKPCIPYSLLPLPVAKALKVDPESLEAKRKAKEEAKQYPHTQAPEGKSRLSALAHLLGAAASDKQTSAPTAESKPPTTRPKTSLSSLKGLLSDAAGERQNLSPAQGGPLPADATEEKKRATKPRVGGASALKHLLGEVAADKPSVPQTNTSKESEEPKLKTYRRGAGFRGALQAMLGKPSSTDSASAKASAAAEQKSTHVEETTKQEQQTETAQVEAAETSEEKAKTNDHMVALQNLLSFKNLGSPPNEPEDSATAEQLLTSMYENVHSVRQKTLQSISAH